MRNNHGFRMLDGPNPSVGLRTWMHSLFKYSYSNIIYPGPLFSLPALNRQVVVINTLSSAIDLLEKRKIFACKPRWPMAELLGRQNNIGFTYYGDRHRRLRAALHLALSSAAIEKDWSSLLDSQSRILARSIYDSPSSFYDSVGA